MPMWTCSVNNCGQAAVRTVGDCLICDRHLCAYHLQNGTHDCPTWMDADVYIPAAREAERKELEKLYQMINVDALTSRASQLRSGLPCSIPNFQLAPAERHSVMGGMNYHIEIVFEDGIRWLARIRRFNATSPPPKLRDHIIKSEAATLKFLETTALPTPKLFDYALEGDANPVGVGYMIIEKLPGTPLQWHRASAQHKSKVMEGLADIFIELSRRPFDMIGSLEDPHSFHHIGALAHESFTDFDTSGSSMAGLGPFCSSKEFHEASIRLTLRLIASNQLYVDRPVDAYLIQRYLLDLLPHIIPDSSNHGQKFYLKHADDKGDHILVDDEHNITGIIDWEWASTAPMELAFNSPIALLPVAEFYDGVNTLGNEENDFIRILEGRSRPDLAEIVRRGRVQHRFAFCCGCDLADWDGFLGLFKGLRDAVGVDNSLDWAEWKEVALERYRSERDLQLLLSRQEALPNH